MQRICNLIPNKHHHHLHFLLHHPFPLLRAFSPHDAVVHDLIDRQVMASANKFATALHRNTNRMTLVLVNALLEWILIALLLAHSLFSFLILRFADYFGLHPPCPLCSSLEHLFRSGRGRTIALCRDHLEGISRSREFAGREDATEDRSSPSVDFGKQVSENVLASRIECPCDGRCNRPRNVHPPDYSLDDHDSQWEVSSMKNGVRNNLEKEEEDEEEWGELRMVNVGVTEAREKIRAEEEEGNLLSPDSESSGIIAVVSREINQEDLGTEEEREVVVQSDKNVVATVDSSALSQPDQISPGMDRRKDESIGTNPQHLEFYIGNDESELILVDLKERYTVGEVDLQNFGGDVILELCTPVEKQCEEASLESAQISFHEIEADDFREMKTIVDALRPEMLEDNVEEEHVLEKAVVAEAETKAPVSFNELKELSEEATGRHEHPHNHPAIAEEEEEEEDEEEEMEGKEHSQDEESDIEVSIGTEIPDHETVDKVSVQEVLPSFEGNRENTSTSYEYDLPQTEPHSGCVQSETETLEFKTIVVEMCELGLSHRQRLCKDMELSNEMEEDKIPDTPVSTDSLGVLHSNLMMLDNRTVGTEGSMEGSLVGDIEGGEEDPKMEQLKEALKEERRSLHALYAELEEERNASAIAANQTMAMINRLQEEKAAMQMEAVQYQRMMEEQSEYDQEALQLLNDVVVETEKEKEELARELEACCRRLEEYEARENVTTPGGNKIRRNSEYSEPEDVDENENTPCDAVACLEETLEDFDEERLCILEHIKSLEEKLVLVAKDEDGPRFEDVRGVATIPENGNGDLNHVLNGEIGENVSKHHRNGLLASQVKRLVPLFDATTEEDGCKLQPRYEDEHSKTEEEDERLAVEEELDYVYERLDALEADGEFLRHCMGSMKKGEKGLDILLEILQYLRDMRSFRD